MEHWNRRLLAALAVGLALFIGAVCAWLAPSPNGLADFGLYSLFAGLGLFSLWWGGRLFQVDPRACWAGLAAWLLRIVVGLALMLLLPVVGNDNAPSNAGYLFDDAFRRDTQAWELAQSGQPLGQAFSGSFSGDQYGGVLALYAAVYRVASPDTHRPLLIILLGAAFTVWGVMAAWVATKNWFGAGPAYLAAWILALYPEYVLLSASHMREALVIPLSAAAWYGLIPLRQNRRLGWLTLATAGLGLLLVQPAFAVVFLIALAGIWLLESGVRFSWRRLALLGLLLALAVGIVFSVWASLPSLQGSRGLEVITNWLSSNFNVQITQTERKSGWMQTILGDIGQQAKGALVTAYGVFRPVLPAALISPGVGIMRLIESLRALGWYLLAPLLLYGAALTFQRSLPEALHSGRIKQLRWLGLVIWGWVVLASANAGGDQWDNPRYRTMLLVLQAAFAAWVWFTLQASRDRWFWRFAGIEAVFVALFTYWYITRMADWAPDVHIYVISACFAAVSAGIVVWGILSDRKSSS